MQVLPITLELNTLQELLIAPQKDPFQPHFRLISGIEEVVQVLRTKPAGQPVEITLALPAGTSITPETEAQFYKTVAHYCSAQMKQNRMELAIKRSGAWRGFRVGLLILGASLGIASVISNTTFLADWLKNFLTNAVSLFGTVALWSPTD
ncbi:MAG: hypothetical protein ABI690_08185 [Chloroflexota bacterium]